MTRKRHAGKTGKTGNWAARHNRDQFVRQARSGGWRARAVFKLQEIDRKYRLIKPGMTVVDLGAAPGSWSQYAAARIGDGRIVAVDKRDMPGIAGVECIRGDFTEAAVAARALAALGGRMADLVLSDLSPDLSGIHSADQARAEALQCAVLAFCSRALRPGGEVLTKVFAGESAPAIRARYDANFEQSRTLKPAASRAQSREVYLLARGFAGAAGPGDQCDPGDQLDDQRDDQRDDQCDPGDRARNALYSATAR